MITFTVWKSGHQYKGFECAGHAGYAEEGSDIICAAVSALAVNTINAIEQFTEDPFEVEEAEDGGLLRIRFSEVPDEKTQLDRKSTRLNSSHLARSRMPSSA